MLKQPLLEPLALESRIVLKALGLKLLTVVLKVVLTLRRRRITITTNISQTILYPKHVRRAYHFRAHKLANEIFIV